MCLGSSEFRLGLPKFRLRFPLPLSFSSPLSFCTTAHVATFAFATFDVQEGLPEAVDEASLRGVDVNAYVPSHVENESANESTR